MSPDKVRYGQLWSLKDSKRNDTRFLRINRVGNSRAEALTWRESEAGSRTTCILKQTIAAKWTLREDVVEIVGRTGGVLVTHAPDACAGENCCVHNPSEHQLSAAPLLWRSDRKLMERVCDHGCGHPDPDDLAHKKRSMTPEQYENGAWGVHGCCGCCRPEGRGGAA